MPPVKSIKKTIVTKSARAKISPHQRSSHSKISDLPPEKIISGYAIGSLDLLNAEMDRSVVDIQKSDAESKLNYSINIVTVDFNIKNKLLAVSYICKATKFIDDEIAFSISTNYLIILREVPKMNKSDRLYVAETFGRFIIWNKFREIFNLSVMHSSTKSPDLPILPRVINSTL